MKGSPICWPPNFVSLSTHFSPAADCCVTGRQMAPSWAAYKVETAVTRRLRNIPKGATGVCVLFLLENKMEFTFVVVALSIGVGTCNHIRSARQFPEWHNSFQVPGPYIPPRSMMDVSLIIDNRSKPKHYALLADAVEQYNLNEADPSIQGLTIDIADSKMSKKCF